MSFREASAGAAAETIAQARAEVVAACTDGVVCVLLPAGSTSKAAKLRELASKAFEPHAADILSGRATQKMLTETLSFALAPEAIALVLRMTDGADAELLKEMISGRYPTRQGRLVAEFATGLAKGLSVFQAVRDSEPEVRERGEKEMRSLVAKLIVSPDTRRNETAEKDVLERCREAVEYREKFAAGSSGKLSGTEKARVDGYHRYLLQGKSPKEAYWSSVDELRGDDCLAAADLFGAIFGLKESASGAGHTFRAYNPKRTGSG